MINETVTEVYGSDPALVDIAWAIVEKSMPPLSQIDQKQRLILLTNSFIKVYRAIVEGEPLPENGS